MSANIEFDETTERVNINAGDLKIQHWTGAEQPLDGFKTPKERAITNIRELKKCSLARQIDALEEFLISDFEAEDNK